MRTLTRASVATAAAVAVLVPTQPAFAIGEKLQERGRTVAIVDGDTIKVNIWGDGTSAPATVRFTGVNANEVGQCHAAAATSRTRGLALNRVTHLYAIDAASHSGPHRLRRTVFAQQPDGSFRNLARTLVTQSLANASPIRDEWGRNGEYRAIQDQKVPLGQLLWDKDACGIGPHQRLPISVTVHWQGGVDSELVEITNNSATRTLGLGGWWVRNSSPSRHVFRAGTEVPPGRTLRLHVGSGRTSGLDHYWGMTVPRFLDASFDEQALGNGAYLVDPHGDIRAFQVYP